MASERFLQQEKLLSPECRDLISTLPKYKGWVFSHFYQYQGYWNSTPSLQGIILCQKHFQAQDSDIFLVTFPKSGTTWLKSIIFTLLNRNRFHVSDDHPLVTQNPHQLVPFLEVDLYSYNNIPDLLSLPSPRLFATHMPYISIPESAKSCKIVYLCRNPKDTLVSNWHFMNKLSPPEMGQKSIVEAFDMFCKGVSPYGPYWDHILEYWKQSKEEPSRVLFMKYEDMREKPELHLRLLAEFLECRFSAEEEESGMLDQILKLCSFDHLRGLKVNKDGVLPRGVANSSFFRKGEVGDWKNYLDADMSDKIDQITQEKFHGSGLLPYSSSKLNLSK